MNGGIVQRGGNLGKIHLSLPDEAFALLQLYPSDILTGRNVHLPVEERRQMRGTDADLPCHRFHGQAFIDIVRNILQRAADNGILVIQRRRCHQALFYAAGVTKDGQKQQLEIAADEIAAVSVRFAALVQNLPEEIRFF